MSGMLLGAEKLNFIFNHEMEGAGYLDVKQNRLP